MFTHESENISVACNFNCLSKKQKTVQAHTQSITI